jgi:3-oxoacyl-[acyl-carrier protein] reductase
MTEPRKVAIVTGSATGIGAACALRLAGHGYNVVINCTASLTEAEETAAACREAGVEVLILPADVADDGQCRALAQAALDAWGRIDALINNAGRTKFVKAEDFEGLTAEDFQSIYAVNTVGAFQTARAAADALRAANGALVNVSSLSAYTGLGSSIAYAASKGALNTLTLSLAQTLAPEVRVNAVCPGYVDTRWMQRTMEPDRYERFLAGLRKHAPLATVTQADDVAEAVCWFVEGGRTITGQMLTIDAGMHLTMG